MPRYLSKVEREKLAKERAFKKQIAEAEASAKAFEAQLEAERKRTQRATAKLLAGVLDHFMHEIARYDLPLVQLLMAEFAARGGISLSVEVSHP